MLPEGGGCVPHGVGVLLIGGDCAPRVGCALQGVGVCSPWVGGVGGCAPEGMVAVLLGVGGHAPYPGFPPGDPACCAGQLYGVVRTSEVLLGAARDWPVGSLCQTPPAVSAGEES